ncbi:hypothetical protein ACU686_26350 [Yinghuangia aomiensis]
MVIFISFLALVAAMLLWIELLLRAAMLYVGAVLATVVYAGLVDRALWPHVRRWVGVMTAVLLSKPIIAIILALSSGSGRTRRRTRSRRRSRASRSCTWRCSPG